MVTWEYYSLKTKQCVFNEHLYVFKGKNFVVQRVITSLLVEREKNLFNLHSFSIRFFKIGPHDGE